MAPKAPPLTAASTSYSKSSTSSLSSSDPDRASSFLTWSNSIDMALSKPIFELTLPTFVEAIYSVPACFFGLIPSLMLGPIVLGVVGLEALDENLTEEDDKLVLLAMKVIVLLLSTAFLNAWVMFLRGNRWVLRNFLGKKILYLVANPWSIGVLYWGVLRNASADEDASSARARIFSLAIYSLYLWSWAVLGVLFLKQWSQRRRPCLKCSREWMSEKKSFPAIPILLSKTQGDESFPSGDAASAAAISIPLAYIDSSIQFSVLGWSITSTVLAAYAITFLASSGRVYFLAHHVMDVTVGALIPYLIHQVSTYMGLGVYDMKWWYPLVVNAIVASYAKWNMARLLNFDSKKVKK